MSSAATVKRDVPESVRRVVLRDANGCAYCGDLVAPLVVEHRKPLGRGGNNHRHNLVAACVACNSQKKTMLVHEWRLWRTTNGMPWPPVASHATERVHYGDACTKCREEFWSGDEADNMPKHRFVCTPYNLIPDDTGYVARYRCPSGHTWQCWWDFWRGYYIDCPCTFCQIGRDDNCEEPEPRDPRYEEPVEVDPDPSAPYHEVMAATLAELPGLRGRQVRATYRLLTDLAEVTTMPTLSLGGLAGLIVDTVNSERGVTS